MSIESGMPFNHLFLCHPLLLLPSIFPSIRVFFNESALHIRRPKYWSFSFNISPSNEHPGLISLRMDGLNLLAVQGTLKSFLQHHSSKASILRRSAFFIVHPYMTGESIGLPSMGSHRVGHNWSVLAAAAAYMTTGKTLMRRTFVGKVMSLPFNMLSRLVVILCYN